MNTIQEIHNYYNGIIKELVLTVRELECKVEELEKQLEEKNKNANIPSL